MFAIFVVCLLTINCAIIYGNPVKPDNRRCFRAFEEYVECGPACEPTCDTVHSSEPIGCVALCVPGCFCRRGYVRNRWGSCIPLDTCPCVAPNEVYLCGSACQTTCDTLNQDCPIKNIKCNTGCYCKDGYARDNNGVCIPQTECSITHR